MAPYKIIIAHKGMSEIMCERPEISVFHGLGITLYKTGDGRSCQHPVDVFVMFWHSKTPSSKAQ